MELLAFIVLGAIAGWIASMIMGTPEGLLMDIIIGIIGAFVGGLVFNMFGSSGVTGLNLYSLAVSVIGAIVLLGVVRAFRRA